MVRLVGLDVAAEDKARREDVVVMMALLVDANANCHMDFMSFP